MIKCKYCRKPIYAWQRWTQLLEGCAHSECCWKAGVIAGEKLKKDIRLGE